MSASTAEAAATKDEDPPPAKKPKLRVTFTEQQCPVCAVPFDELLGVPKVVFGGCQHAVCIPCVQKHQGLGKSETACGCREPYKFELRQPPSQASEPLLLKLTVTYRNDGRFRTDRDIFKVSVLFEVQRDDTDENSNASSRVRIAMVSNRRYASFVDGFWDDHVVRVPSDGKRVGFGVLLQLKHLMRQCDVDGECNDYDGDPCSKCAALRDASADHIQCIASLKENRQLDLVFPDYQGSRAGDLEVVPMAAPAAACSVSVPLVVPAAGNAAASAGGGA